MGTRRHGDKKTCGQGDMGTRGQRGYGDKEKWRLGDLGTWGLEDWAISSHRTNEVEK